MPRKRALPAADPAPPPVIDAHAVFCVDQLQHLLRLRASTVRREVREGRLRIAKRAGRYFVLGSWVLEWLASGELPRRRPGDQAGA